LALYADTNYFVALLVPSDNLRPVVQGLLKTYERERIVTSEPVLVELLAHVSRLGDHARSEAVGVIEDNRTDTRVTLVPQTPELFNDGLELYRRRLDKRYSLTDCMSMSICKRLAITDVLTHDNHFAQEGFTILL
jgi:predicted nucleic acid-binding protein